MSYGSVIIVMELQHTLVSKASDGRITTNSEALFFLSLWSITANDLLVQTDTNNYFSFFKHLISQSFCVSCLTP